MARHAGKATRLGREPGNRGVRRSGRSGSEGDSCLQGKFALPANPSLSLRHLDDGDLVRLLEAATAETRRRGRLEGKTAGGTAHGKPASVTTGQAKLILAAFGAGLKPAAIMREFRLSRTQVGGVLKGAG